MKLLSKLLCGATMLASAAVAQYTPADMIITSADEYSVTFKKEYQTPGPYGGKSWTITEVIENDVSKVEYVDGSLDCGISSYYCFANFKIKKDGPVDFTNQGFIGGIAYGYADNVDEANDTAWINTQLWTQFHIAEVLTRPVASASPRGNLARIGRAESNKVSETAEYIEVRTLIGLQSMDASDPAEYQNLHFIASGQAILKLFDVNELAPGYVTQDANKGQAFGFVSTNGFQGDYFWWNSDWNVSGGHYAALRFFTNGTSELDQGRDLSAYNTVTFEVECEAGWTIEVLMGSAQDSFQQFLTDVQCDGNNNSYTFPVSGNRTDIQTGLWFHIPTWKNGSMGQDNGANMIVGKVVFY